ncbi:alpha/beta hydrolase [Streptomyces chartreusis]|uniref:alpha/beta hydrolase n=1 Tax=Streptomyces chartreusis TaxID=1969 RepID=UPI0037AB2261
MLLVNPGGPGSGGLETAGEVAAQLPADVSAQYDVIGFDPRGVGRSEPSLDCTPGHHKPPRPDPIPGSAADERAGVAQARAFAEACGSKYGDTLRHMDTVSTARDMDLIRAALGAGQVSYFGRSYGSYLGAVYAALFPQRVRRLVLDSIVADADWYTAGLRQARAFDTHHKAFTEWMARHDSTYNLGTDAAAIEARWYRMREAMRQAPADGRVGPAELEDMFKAGGMDNRLWPYLAEAFVAYVRQGDSTGIVEIHDWTTGRGAPGNGISSGQAVTCRDAPWPRDWRTWHSDTAAVHREAPFWAWNNTWSLAPCAFWPVASLAPLDLTNRRIPPALILQATDDAATLYEDALRMRRLLHGSRLVVEQGGFNHLTALVPGRPNPCVDTHVSRYLRDGALPAHDTTCPPLPEPQPTTARGARPFPEGA